MPYVERDQNGEIAGLYARPQPGRAEERVEDDHRDVVTFRAEPKPTWWQKRKDAYREKIAQYKGIPEATHEDVIGFVIDAQVKAQVAGDTTELQEIAALVAQVKSEIPKP